VQHTRSHGRVPRFRRPPARVFVGTLIVLAFASGGNGVLAHGQVRQRISPWKADIDPSRLASVGIRRIPGKRLTLYTDVPPSVEIERLPTLFVEAFPQWCAYFDIDPAKHRDWHVTGCLIRDKAKFQAAGLIRPGVPDFRNGFSWNYDLWMNDQEADYYRRHLLLHEGVHSFMNTLLGNCGPAWYMEGMAEMLATHSLVDGRLTINYFPATREEVPGWGRIRIVKDALAERRAMRFSDVLAFTPKARDQTEPYAWCWTMAAWLDRHPRYRDRFRELRRKVRDPNFSRQFLQAMGNDRELLAEEWQSYIVDLEYGTDVSRTAVDFTSGKPLPVGGAEVSVKADRGWQNSGIRLEKGRRVRIRATGRYQVADEPKIWWSEPGGVSIRYYHGRPLGTLLATLRSDDLQKGQVSGLLRPFRVGLGTSWTPSTSGTLYFRVNDSSAELHDNAGKAVVRIEAVTARGDAATLPSTTGSMKR